MNKVDFIKIIGYNEEWFSLKFLPTKFVDNQIKDFINIESSDIEQYKWAGYRYVLDNEDFSKLERLKEFMLLIENDPNEHLYKGAVSELINKKIITADKLQKLGIVRFSSDKKIMDKIC